MSPRFRNYENTMVDQNVIIKYHVEHIKRLSPNELGCWNGYLQSILTPPTPLASNNVEVQFKVCDFDRVSGFKFKVFDPYHPLIDAC